jgi:signal transduction histidine kinase
VHVAAIRDITERKRVEDALRQANRQLSLLSDVTRHDILNMISVIFGYLDVAEEESNSPVMGECLRKIYHSIRTIQSEIEFTRLYQNLGTSEPAWMNVKKLLPYRQVPQDVIFIAEIPDISINADPMLEKVFYNLLDNSIRHGKHVTRITLSALPEETGIVLIYEDNGVGIPINEKEKVFERGYGKNSGLGLFLVREILSITGITIFESGTSGAGARFEMHIPKGAFRFPKSEEMTAKNQ